MARNIGSEPSTREEYYVGAKGVSTLRLLLICDAQRVSLQVVRGVTSWRFRFWKVIRPERHITTLIWVSQSVKVIKPRKNSDNITLLESCFTFVTLVAVVVFVFVQRIRLSYDRRCILGSMVISLVQRFNDVNQRCCTRCK